MKGAILSHTFLQSWARELVLLHTAAAIALVGASTHHFVLTIGTLRGDYQPRKDRLYAAVVGISYAVTTGLGALAYPTYRYYVRGLYLDRYAQWASNLFDIKENMASLGLPLALGALAISRVIDSKEDRSMLFGYAAMVFGTTAIVWFNTIA